MLRVTKSPPNTTGQASCSLRFLLRYLSCCSLCHCLKKGSVGMCLLLFYTPCKFSFEIRNTVSLTKFFKGRLLDPVVKRREGFYMQRWRVSMR